MTLHSTKDMGPEREFWPCSPLPAVVPWPAAFPLPTRVLLFFAPGLSLIYDKRKMENYAIRFNVTAENERATHEIDKEGMMARCLASTPLQKDANIVSRELCWMFGIPNNRDCEFYTISSLLCPKHIIVINASITIGESIFSRRTVSATQQPDGSYQCSQVLYRLVS